MTSPAGFMRDLSPEAQSRRSRKATHDVHQKAAAGRAARAVSPWGRGPMCDTPNAAKAFKRYTEAGKVCPDCKTRKALTEFHPRTNRAGGHDTYCKPCRRARWRKWANGDLSNG